MKSPPVSQSNIAVEMDSPRSPTIPTGPLTMEDIDDRARKVFFRIRKLNKIILNINTHTLIKSAGVCETLCPKRQRVKERDLTQSYIGRKPLYQQKIQQPSDNTKTPKSLKRLLSVVKDTR